MARARYREQRSETKRATQGLWLSVLSKAEHECAAEDLVEKEEGVAHATPAPSRADNLDRGPRQPLNDHLVNLFPG